MKTEKLQLQPYDNIDSILDKMAQIYQTTRGLTQVQILWPRRGRVLEDPLDYGRIAGWAERHGIELAFVSNDGFVSELAAEQRIPIYREATDIPKSPVFRQKRFQLKRSDSQRMIKLSRLRSEIESLRAAPQASRGRLPLFLIAILAFFIGLYLILPHARVVVGAVPQTRELKFHLWTSDQLDSFTMNGGVPSERMRFTLDRSVTLPATGVIQSIAKLATGTLHLANTCDRAQTVPAGVHFSRSADQPWLFHNLVAVTIEPGAEQAVAIEADTPGAAYNFPPGVISVIQVPYERCITVRQSAATGGGDDGEFITPTDEDYAQAADQIRAGVLAEAEALMSEKAGALNLPLSHSFQIEKILTEKRNPEIGYAGETLRLEQSVQISLRVVSRQNIYRQAELAFAMFPQEGFNPQSGGTNYQIIPDSETVSEGQYAFEVIASQTGSGGVDPDEIRALIRGKSLEDATRLIMRHFPGGQESEITIWPAWMTFLPVTSANIWIEAR